MSSHSAVVNRESALRSCQCDSMMLRLGFARSPSPSTARHIAQYSLFTRSLLRKNTPHTVHKSSGPAKALQFVQKSVAVSFRLSWDSFRSSGAVCFSMASGGDGPTRSKPPKHTNRLSKEKSSYLLQHAHNPVDWYPWGKEAFDKAKNEDKPIFLSVGYSTCHWCHVMERESFEDEEIGKILSENFVCIKVDREERPDVDKVYMTFVQATSGGGGGWPMSVWLTPDLRPFIGGTYFPPRDMGRRAGLKTVLLRIIEQWKNNRETLESSGERVLEALRKGTAISANPGETPPSGPDVANRCFQQLAQSYEEEYGGFREAPKFPSPVNLMFLMSFWAVNRATTEGAEALHMALHTLRMMALGGIHDHVAQGFHRYSTDSSWHVPHFEKMLYDQAQLAVAYITAYQVSGEHFFADVARDVLLYVSRDLRDKSGGFYSAEDADSFPTAESAEKREGAFCVWTAGEIRELLPDFVEAATGGVTQADIFMHHYGVKEQGNVDPAQDPHGELQGQNVLIVRYSVELTAAHFGISVDRLSKLLAHARTKLAEVRRARPPPHLDTKMLASWNGLMLSGFARVGAVLEDEALLKQAEQAACFLKQHLWDDQGQKILHSCYRGNNMEVEQIASPIAGFLDDYAFVVCGLLDLFEATQKVRWLEWAGELQQRQDELFWDSQGSGYFCSDPSDPTLLLALKQDQDGAEPSANSVSAMNLQRLSHLTGRQEWMQRSQQLLAAFSDRLLKVPIALPDMVRSVMSQHHSLKQIVICGQPDAEDTASLISSVSSLFLPHKVLILADGNTEGFLYKRLPMLSTLVPQDGKATAYVCENFTCTLPVTCPQVLRRLLLE
nr:spermatogenesis-associated protein 20 [Misgurnus anguillicaudatus]